MKERIRKLIANELQMDPKDVDDNAGINNPDKWDSLAQIGICLAVQEAFGIDMATDDIATATSLNALAVFVAGKVRI